MKREHNVLTVVVTGLKVIGDKVEVLVNAPFALWFYKDDPEVKQLALMAEITFHLTNNCIHDFDVESKRAIIFLPDVLEVKKWKISKDPT